MPSSEAHLERVRANAAFRLQIVADRLSAEWAVVVLFYEAVHRFEAWFATEEIHHAGHIQRNRAIIRRFPEISFHYIDLYHASRAARYDPVERVSWDRYERLAESYREVEAFLDR